MDVTLLLNRSTTPAHREAQRAGVAVSDLGAEGSARSPARPGCVDSSNKVFLDYFRCPPGSGAVDTLGELSETEGYFTFAGTVCYGRPVGSRAAAEIGTDLPDVSCSVECDGEQVRLPFDLSEVVTNHQQERYRRSSSTHVERIASAALSRRVYYFLRPMLPVPIRKHLQRIRLNGWERISFPQWPVDFSVETLMQRTMALMLKSRGIRQMPFIWFWPDGAQSCVMMTHDVEGKAGRAFCDELIDLDDSFGIKAAFQVVPQPHCENATGFVEKLRSRGFEVNLHDFNHDGDLFREKEQFLRRAAQINAYARELGCRGFRSGSMYREQSWYDAFEFSFDMSVPNAAHLEPQRGGCCTVMPYRVGRLLELPLTTTQDYSLFHILGQYSTTIWEQQIESISSRNGLITFITHPDYLIERRARDVYCKLLEHLCRIRDERRLWIALPGEVDAWWRNRQCLALVPDGDSWRIEGPGSERARLAYAVLDGDTVRYRLGGE
jgi:hypothetical protein